MKKVIGTTLITAAAFLGLSAGVQAAPIPYNFEQTGYSEGASVTGWFRAEDLNTDGQVSLADGEIFDFSLSFSGNSFVDAFNLMFADLTYFVYNLDGFIGEVFDDEGIDAVGGDFEYAGGPGVFFTECGLGFGCAFLAGPSASDFSDAVVSVDVPEPAAGALLLTGLLGTGLVLRRRNAA